MARFMITPRGDVSISRVARTVAKRCSVDKVRSNLELNYVELELRISRGGYRREAGKIDCIKAVLSDQVSSLEVYIYIIGVDVDALKQLYGDRVYRCFSGSWCIACVGGFVRDLDLYIYRNKSGVKIGVLCRYRCDIGVSAKPYASSCMIDDVDVIYDLLGELEKLSMEKDL